MSDLLLDELPTRWHGHEIVPDFRPMVWLVNSYVRGSVNTDPVGFAQSAIWRFYKDPHCFLTDDQMLFDGYQHLLEFYQAGERRHPVVTLPAFRRHQLHCPLTTSATLRISWRRSSGCTAST